MLPISVLKFLKDLDKNNNKPWFDTHRDQYEQARSIFLENVGQLITGISAFDKTIASLEPKNCIFRINRDVRFSKDKKPYKNNLAAYFNKDGKKGNGAGYYLHIQPGKSFVAGGIWMPEAPELAKIRQEIDYHFDELIRVTGTTSFKKRFPNALEKEGSLQRPPRGYDDSNPAIDLIKLKSFIVSAPLKDELLTSKACNKEVLKSFETMYPVITFLNTAIS